MSVYRPKYRDKKTGEQLQQAVWWYDFKFAGQRYNNSTRQTLKTLVVQFEKNERRRAERALAGLPTEVPKQRIRTVSEALNAYREGYETGHQEKSIAWVKERTAHVERLLGAVILPDLTETRIREYMKSRLAEGVGNRTVNMELLCLSRAIHRTWRELWPNVPKLEEPEDIGRALIPEEEMALLTAAAANPSPYIDRFIRIALTSVTRSGEIRRLQVARINFVDRTVQVGRAKSKKGTGRVIPMNIYLYSLLREQIAWL